MQELRIIKRYSNRRLYDTGSSRYITLDEVQELVLKQIKFKIIDDQTNEDLTSYVLLQIITSQENGRFPIFTTEVLENIIRFYGNPVQKTVSQFLEKSFSLFAEQKNGFNEYLKDHPLDMMTELTKRNLNIWQSTFSEYFNKDTKKSSRSTKKTKTKSKTSSKRQ